MKRTIILPSLVTALVVLSPAAAALAGTGNPSGTGQPSVECGDGIGDGPHGFTTGGFANAETKYAGSEGTPSAVNGGPKAISQYDVACAHAAAPAQVDATAPTTPDSTTSTVPGADTPKKVHPLHGHK
jgi:hypothetical protein